MSVVRFGSTRSDGTGVLSARRGGMCVVVGIGGISLATDRSLVEVLAEVALVPSDPLERSSRAGVSSIVAVETERKRLAIRVGIKVDGRVLGSKSQIGVRQEGVLGCKAGVEGELLCCDFDVAIVRVEDVDFIGCLGRRDNGWGADWGVTLCLYGGGEKHGQGGCAQERCREMHDEPMCRDPDVVLRWRVL